MTGEQRQRLRELLDAQARARLDGDVGDCEERATEYRYRLGCRCPSCKRLMSELNRRRRDAYREAYNAAERDRHRRRRERAGAAA